MSASAVEPSDQDEAVPSSRRPWVLAGVLGLFLLAFALQWYLGRPTPPALGDVSGVVTLDGKPVPDLQVRFLPDPAKGSTGDEAMAFTGPDGAYKVRVNRWGRDGAVVGTHRVVVTDWSRFAAGRPAAGDAGPGGSSPARIPVVYGDVARTPLQPYEVKPGEQVYDIALSSKPK